MEGYNNDNNNATNNVKSRINSDVIDAIINDNSDAVGIRSIDDQWREWKQKETTEWIKAVLLENNFSEQAIDQFMSNVFLKLNINGKVLLQLKTNSEFWNDFKDTMKNESLGIWIVISNAIKELELNSSESYKD